MSTKYKATNAEKAYFITVTTVNWIDVFTRLNQKMIFVDSLAYCQRQKGLEIFAYVLMSNHLHMLCRAKVGFQLPDIIRDFKEFTSKEITRKLKEEPESRREWMLDLFSKACEHLKRSREYKVWQDGYHAEEIFSNKFIYQKLDYIHDNPVRQRIVQKPEDYLFSSARNYAGLQHIIEVELLPPELKTIK